MKVNHNMSAVITNAQLLKTENSLSASMERLSSGLKINHAKDDPAGIAITNKMQAQIDGLAKASENSSNGISVLQIADTALNEITSMLQRMRELSVQAASDTNQIEDREAIQEEIESLRNEVDRISRDTEYNTKKLLDGASDTRVYAKPDYVSRMAITDKVKVGDYKIDITSAAEQATYEGQESDDSGNPIPEGKININGMEVKIEEGEDAVSVYEKLRYCAEKGDVKLFIPAGDRENPPVAADPYAKPPVEGTAETGGYKMANKDFDFGDKLVFVSNQYGNLASIDIKSDNPALLTFLGITTYAKETVDDPSDIDPDAQKDIYHLQESGKDAVMTPVRSAVSSFGPQATLTTDGNKVKVTDANGFEMSFLAKAGAKGEVNIEVTDIGTMTLQIGANEHQTMEVRIPEISSQILYLDEIDVTKVEGGGKAISRLDKALATVTSARSAVGAYQNRLEYAVDSLDASHEDMTAAITRIGDVDMAKEMTEYTKYNVLQQAGTSVLAQANDIPQTVLQLLQ